MALFWLWSMASAGEDRLRFLDFEGYQSAIFFLARSKDDIFFDDIFFKVHAMLEWNDPF